MSAELFDVLVVGGGVNGVGIARDAAGRGLRTVLCEQDDLGAHTSSRSTKLIHGGLRYLEHYEFRLVRESLTERERLLRAAPHIVWPVRFVLPHHPRLRHPWLIRAGLLLYDHLGARDRLPPSCAIDLRAHVAGEPLARTYRRGFVYSDCCVLDSRLVVLVALSAHELGVTIMPRTRLVCATVTDGVWRASLMTSSGETAELAVRCIVNAAGPWATEVSGARLGRSPRTGLRLVAGSHIVVPALFAHDYAYLFQQDDGRVVFAIPYERRFTLIGTTEREVSGDPAKVEASPAEVDYLCAAVNGYFAREVKPGDVAWTYTGVRALVAERSGDVSAATRDCTIELDAGGGAPVLSVLGGKLTTFRKVAEQVVDRLAEHLRCRRGRWTATAALPGGDLPDGDFDAFLASVREERPWLSPALSFRLCRQYGTRIERLLGSATAEEALGRHFGHGLYEAELDYLLGEEWARSAEDVLWRRTKLGLELSAEERLAVDDWLTGARGVRQSLGWR